MSGPKVYQQNKRQKKKRKDSTDQATFFHCSLVQFWCTTELTFFLIISAAVGLLWDQNLSLSLGFPWPCCRFLPWTIFGPVTCVAPSCLIRCGDIVDTSVKFSMFLCEDEKYFNKYLLACFILRVCFQGWAYQIISSCLTLTHDNGSRALGQHWLK